MARDHRVQGAAQPAAGAFWSSVWFPAALFAASLLASLEPMPGGVELIYGRGAVGEGEWYRLITCHFVHFCGAHLMLSGGLLLLLGVLLWGRSTWRGWAASFVAGALACGAGLYVFRPGLEHYYGMSGALHGLLVFALVRVTAEHRLAGGLMLALLVAKLAWEQVHGALPSSEVLVGGPVVVQAHLFGAIGGFLAVMARSSRLAHPLSTF